MENNPANLFSVSLSVAGSKYPHHHHQDQIYHLIISTKMWLAKTGVLVHPETKFLVDFLLYLALNNTKALGI